MTRRIPKVGALCEQVRRPAILMIVGLALMSPAGALRLREANTSNVSRSARGAEVERVQDELARAVAENAKERQLQREAAMFAQHYEVPAELAQKIHTIAVEEKVDPKIAFGLVRTESAFNTKAVSHVGAVGLTQVMPRTASWWRKGTTRNALFNPDTNLRIGFQYLNYLVEKYDGNTRLALTAYNRGPGTVDRLLKRGRNPENGYATKVLSSKRGRRI